MKKSTLIIIIEIIFMILLLILIIDHKPPDNKDWWNNDWKYRREIKIDNSIIEGNLTDYPLLVTIKDSGLTKAQLDGDDFIFVDKDNNTCYYEIEKWNATKGELIAWVNIKSFSDSEVTILNIYYGNHKSGKMHQPEKVWDTNFVAVYHMAGDSYKKIKDSTSNDLDVIDAQGDPLYNIEGKIGYCVYFDNDSLNVNDNDILSFTDINGNDKQMTIEAWVKSNSVGELNPIVSKYEIYNREWLLWKNNENKGMLYFLDDSSGGSINRKTESSLNYDTNGWIYIAATYNGNETGLGISFILNGEIEKGEYFSGPAYKGMENTNAKLRIGAYNTDSGGGAWYYWQGTIDEVRISNIVRSTEWLKTNYNMMNYPTSFINIGDEEKNETNDLILPILIAILILSAIVSSILFIIFRKKEKSKIQDIFKYKPYPVEKVNEDQHMYIYCQNCGKNNIKESTFCVNCGKKLK